MSSLLTRQADAVLAALSSTEEYCHNYSGLEGDTGIARKYLKPIIKHLKELGFIDFWTGLMTDDGEVAGSGWCRSRKGNEYVESERL